MVEGNWFKAHWKQVMTHTVILSGFLLYCVFFAGPLFDSTEGTGESKLQNLSLPVETNNVRYNIDKLEPSDYGAIIDGWAFIDGHDSNNNLVYIVLDSDNGTYVFSTYNYSRPDVTSFFKDMKLNLDKSGFNVLIPPNRIRNGIYKIGIYIKKGDIDARVYTGKMVIKSGDSIKLTVQ